MFTTRFLLAFCCSLVASSVVPSGTNDKPIDGSEYKMNTAGITYTQHVSEQGQCSVGLNEESKILLEGELVKIKKKWYKVENCRLDRAYLVPCGSKLFYQLRDLACAVAKQSSDSKLRMRRQTKDALMDLLNQSYYHACCESACTVSDFVQSCSRK